MTVAADTGRAAARAYHTKWRRKNASVLTGESKVCNQCAKTYYRYRNMPRWNWERRQFCSPACRHEGTRALRSERISAAKRGKAPWHAIAAAHTPSAIAKNAAAHIGKKQSLETRRKRSEKLRGSNGPNWRGGIYPEHMRIRRSGAYRMWALAVKERDAHRCVWCGAGGNLHADHIKRFSDHPELRFDVRNGRTLCAPCHRTTETWGRRSAA